MIILDTTTRRLQVVLGAAGALPFVSSWTLITGSTQRVTAQATTTGTTNGTTPVDLVAVPGLGSIKQIIAVTIRNDSGAGADVTVRYDDNGTARDIVGFALDDGDMLQYTDGEGWRVFAADGSLKGSGGGAGAALTVEEVDGAPSVTSVSKIKFAQGDGLSVTDEGGGVARINAASAPAPDYTAQAMAMLALLEF